jgi:hypothetical protein
MNVWTLLSTLQQLVRRKNISPAGIDYNSYYVNDDNRLWYRMGTVIFWNSHNYLKTSHDKGGVECSVSVDVNLDCKVCVCGKEVKHPTQSFKFSSKVTLLADLKRILDAITSVLCAWVMQKTSVNLCYCQRNIPGVYWWVPWYVFYLLIL